MARIKIDIPDHFIFSTPFRVRITDLNYGSHVGNDKILSYLHEARVLFLHSLGYTELNFAGAGLIMADAALIFRNEIYYGDELLIHVQPGELTRVGFDLIYKLEKITAGGSVVAALAKTAMICFDYQAKKVTTMPEDARNKLLA